MTTTTFDTLGYFEKLKAAGVPEEQAKVQANAIREVIEDKLVTKAELASQLKELEYRLTIRLGGMMAASIALVAASVKLA